MSQSLKQSTITQFAQPAGMDLSQYAEKIVAKTLRWEDVHEEYELHEIFIERLDPSMWQNMRGYWGKEGGNMAPTRIHVTAQFRLQGRDILCNSKPSSSAGQAATKNKAHTEKHRWRPPRTDVHNVDSKSTIGPEPASKNS